MGIWLGTGLAAVLGIMGLLHLAWAAGVHFPFASEEKLARAVVGRRGVTRLPSRAATAFVGLLLIAAGVAAWLMSGASDRLPGSKYVLAPVGLFLAFVFLARGIVGVLPAFERSLPEQPFLTLNRRLYSPLCLAIGLAFLLMTASLPNWAWRLHG